MIVEDWMPLAMSLVALVAWLFSGVGLVDHWRRGWNIPVRALAASILASVSAVIAYLVASGVYFDPGWTSVSRPVANIERAFLATTGVVALSSLVRSAWRQRR